MDPDLAMLLSSAAPAAAAAAQTPQAPAQPTGTAAPPPPPTTSGVSGGAGGPASQPTPAPDNTVQGVTVTANPNYGNTAQAKGVLKAMGQEPDPTGAAPGQAHGIWGLLPPNMQHGTLRNTLGALGDMFLVGSGRQMQYTPHLQGQQNAIALAGYGQPANGGMVNTGQTDKDGQPIMRPMTADERQASIYQNSQKAIERLMATGNPGTGQQGIAMEENLNNANIHRDQMNMMNQYRQQQIEARNQANIQRMSPYVGGLAGQAKDSASYQKAYDQAEAMAQRIGPDYHASDFGLPDPKDWQPGMSLGATGGQTLRAQTSEDSIAERGAASTTAHNDRMYHYTHPTYAPRQPTTASMLQSLMKIPPEQRTPEQQAFVTRYTQPTSRPRPLLTTGGGQVQQPQHIQPANGPPPANEVNYFKGKPQFKAQFEARYGQGAWKKYIGN